MSFLFTYLHFLSFITLIALLAAEFFLIRSKLNAESLSLIKKIDLFYGIAAGAVLATGIARIYHEKGVEYYLQSPVFWTKIALFILMAIISLYPTVLFIKAKTETDLSISRYTQLKKAILAQMLLVPIILFMAIWMARGIY
jgi:putative membrane protein